MGLEAFAGTCALAAIVGPSWLLAPAVASLASHYAASRARSRRYADGLEPLTAGDFDGAFAHYEELSRTAGTLAMRRSAFMMMGYIEKRRGEFEAALEHYGRMVLPNRPQDSLGEIAWISMAQIHALRGEPVDLSTVPISSETARFMFTEIATICCRTGRYDAVEDLKEPSIPRTLERHAGHERRLLALMNAIARTAMGATDVDQYTDAAAPALPGEFDYLSCNWPELERFIASCNWPVPHHTARATLPPARVV